MCPPLPNVELQVLPQLMPAGLLVTVPLVGAVPLFVTFSVFVATAVAIVNGNALEAVVVPELRTDTWAVPAAAMSPAGMEAFS